MRQIGLLVLAMISLGAFATPGGAAAVGDVAITAEINNQTNETLEVRLSGVGIDYHGQAGPGASATSWTAPGTSGTYSYPVQVGGCSATFTVNVRKDVPLIADVQIDDEAQRADLYSCSFTYSVAGAGQGVELDGGASSGRVTFTIDVFPLVHAVGIEPVPAPK